MDVIAKRNYLTIRDYIQKVLDKILICLKINGCQNFDTEEKRVLF